MNAMMDDPEFQKYLIGKLPAYEIKRAHDEYMEKQSGHSSFEHWLETLYTRPDAMLMLRKIYELDQMAKARNEVWAINMMVARRTPQDPKKRRTDQITIDEIIDFYNSLQ